MVVEGPSLDRRCFVFRDKSLTGSALGVERSPGVSLSFGMPVGQVRPFRTGNWLSRLSAATYSPLCLAVF